MRNMEAMHMRTHSTSLRLGTTQTCAFPCSSHFTCFAVALVLCFRLMMPLTTPITYYGHADGHYWDPARDSMIPLARAFCM